MIWFVQFVHYPLVEAVGFDHFVAYESAHQKRTSWVVGPLMGVEACPLSPLPPRCVTRPGSC